MATSDGQPGIPNTASGGEPRHFVNHLSVSLSLSEARFDLLSLGAGCDAIWHFVTTPDHLVTMQQGFRAALDRYQVRYGDIRSVAADPAAVTFDEGEADG